MDYRRPKGFSLIEVLVAVLVLSIGLLGIAGLQVISLKSTRDANLRTQALLMSQEILESMRANRAYVLSELGNSNYAVKFGDALSTPTENCFLSSCSRAQMASFDVSRWRKQIYSTTENPTLYPEGDAQVIISNNGTVTVSIRWTNSRNPDDNTTSPATFSLSSML